MTLFSAVNQESLGVAAFNDSILLEASVYNIIDRHFAKLDCYPLLLREFHNASTLLLTDLVMYKIVIKKIIRGLLY